MSLRRAVGLAAVSLAVLSACGEGAGPLAGSDETARRDASAALESVETLRSDLESELDDLADQIESATTDDDRFQTRLAKRLDHLAARLDRSLRRMTRRLAEADGATAAADSALAEARAVARELAVLDKRLDYHLSKHGG